MSHVSQPREKHCSGCFRVLADGTRIAILKILKDGGSKKNVTHLTSALGVTQPTVSHHLKELYSIGLVEKERQGRETYYSFNKGYPCRGCGVFSAGIKV